MLRDDVQGALLAYSAGPDRNAGLKWLGLGDGVLDLEVLPVEGRSRLRPECAEDLDGLVWLINALTKSAGW